MSNSFHWNDTTTVSRDGVTVERELEGRDDGIIVTMDLRADVSGPLTVEVIDEFPADLPARQAGFNVEYEPDDGDLSLERARFRHTIEEESARIVYAIRLSEPIADPEFDDPSIEDVTLPGLSGGDDTASETMTRGGGVEQDEDGTADGDLEVPDGESESSERGPTAFDSSGFESGSGTDLRPDTSTDDVAGGTTAEATEATADRSVPISDGDAADSEDAQTDSPGVAGPDAAAIERAIAETERSSDDTADAKETSGGDESGGGTDERDASGVDLTPKPDRTTDSDGDRDADSTSGGHQGATSGSDASTGGRPSGTTDPADEGSDAATDAGAPADAGGTDRTPGGAARGRSAAGEAGAGSGDEMSRSVRLRLDRLNARVEEFATYAEALEDIIEREGTGPEIIENLESNLSAANERLESVRADVDTLQSAHDDDVSTVRDRIDELEAELETARSDLRSDLVNVRGTVDDIGADVERVDHETSENAADVEDLRDDVGAVRQTVDDVAGDVEHVDDATAENAEEVQSVREHLETVESAVHSLDERVDGHEAELEDVGETVESVQTDVADLTESVEAMRSDVESLQTDVDRLLRFREILSDVFGGPVQRATEDARDLEDLSGDDRQDDGSVSTPSEPSR